MFSNTEHWDTLQPALVRYICIGLEYPLPNAMNKCRCQPMLQNPNMALTWDQTDEGQEYWNNLYQLYCEYHDALPVPDEDDEENDDDDN